MSSVANAQNNFSIDVDRLYVKEILVGKGMKLKRFAARARGRASRVHKHPTKSYQKKCPSKKAAATDVICFAETSENCTSSLETEAALFLAKTQQRLTGLLLICLDILQKT